MALATKFQDAFRMVDTMCPTYVPKAKEWDVREWTAANGQFDPYQLWIREKL